MHLSLSSAVRIDKPSSTWLLSGVFVFVSVFCYHALNHIGDNLEDLRVSY